jgi:hypothetical protein
LIERTLDHTAACRPGGRPRSRTDYLSPSP